MNGKFSNMHYKRPSLAVLDVGHGNSAVLSDSGGVVVIDSGAGSALSEFLETQEIKQIDVLLLSHADKDHIGGLVALLAAKTVDIARVCLNGDASKGTEVWDDLLFVLNQESLKGRIVLETSIARDDFGKYNQGSVQVRVLGPSKYLVGKGVNGKERFKRKIRSNSLSVVVRLLSGRKAFGSFCPAIWMRLGSTTCSLTVPTPVPLCWFSLIMAVEQEHQ